MGNAVTLTSEVGGSALLRALNGIAPDIAFTAARTVTGSFRVRAATRRIYRYFEPAGHHDFGAWPEVARRFSGTIDVRSFGRAVSPAAPLWRTVESVTVTPVSGGVVIEIRAPSFVWGMVRKIVGALREVEEGRLPPERLEAALRGQVRLTLPMAEADRLVLWEVEYPDPWEYHWRGPNRHQAAWERRARDALWTRERFLDALEWRDRA